MLRHDAVRLGLALRSDGSVGLQDRAAGKSMVSTSLHLTELYVKMCCICSERLIANVILARLRCELCELRACLIRKKLLRQDDGYGSNRRETCCQPRFGSGTAVFAVLPNQRLYRVACSHESTGCPIMLSCTVQPIWTCAVLSDQERCGG